MAWYNFRNWFPRSDQEKLNPAQGNIRDEQGQEIPSTAKAGYGAAFRLYESVNRGVGLIVGACSGLDYDVKNTVAEGTVPGMRAKTLYKLLNHRPNPYQSVQDFRNQIFTDFLLEGNAFIYYDGAHLYHLPACNMAVIPDPKTFISHYEYSHSTKFLPEEIIHLKDLSNTTIYRGTSRLIAAERNLRILEKMQSFQETFFDNGAVPGLAVTTDNTLSEASKERTINRWMQRYNIKSGARRPMILDSGLKPIKLSENNFRELDFDNNVKSNNVRILETLGVPPVLLDGGNQANISPNLRLFYLETILPILRKYTSGVERMFGYDVDVIVSNASALQPELKEIASYFSTLTNGGLMTPNEAREELRLPKDAEPNSDKLRIPANIAGSAADPNQGGAPRKTEPVGGSGS